MPAVAGSRADLKRRLILDAATALFLAYGYDGTSMDDIATRAGVSKPTVYKHFADKERLFAEIVLTTTERMHQMSLLRTEAMRGRGQIERSLRDFARVFLSELMQPDLLRLRRLVIANADRFPEVGRAWYANGFERVLATLAAELQRLQDRGLLEIESAGVAADHFVGLLLWIPINKAMFTGDVQSTTPKELHEYADLAVRTFLRAYAKREPRLE